MARVQRSLQSRDQVHVALGRAQDRAVADDVISAFDSVLLMLLGAINAAARGANIALSIGFEPHQVSWQSKAWIKEVRQAAPELARLVAPGSEGGSAWTLLRHLRNTIHGEGIDPLTARDYRSDPETFMGMPRSQSKDVKDAFLTLGGESVLGIEEKIPGRLYANPASLLEYLYPKILTLLDKMMTETPVENLPSVSLGSDQLAPPPDEEGPFAERSRLSVRWQLGL